MLTPSRTAAVSAVRSMSLYLADKTSLAGESIGRSFLGPGGSEPSGMTNLLATALCCPTQAPLPPCAAVRRRATMNHTNRLTS